MRRFVLVVIVLTLIGGTAVPCIGSGWWWICWRQVALGVDRHGKVYCNECRVEFREKRGMSPSGTCESFLSRDSAEEFYNRKCDCPGGGFPR